MSSIVTGDACEGYEGYDDGCEDDGKDSDENDEVIMGDALGCLHE